MNINCNDEKIAGHCIYEPLYLYFFFLKMSPFILIAVFIVATLLGYVVIRNVPSLLHTPLMSGMNALSGVTIIGALSATGAALISGDSLLRTLFGMLAIILATINVIGGFGVTHRMLRMFSKKKEGGKK